MTPVLEPVMMRRVAAAFAASPGCDTLVDDIDMALAIEAADAELKNPKVITEFVNPPIPPREFDWSAVRDGYEPGDPIGYGRTELDAVQQLMVEEAERS